MRLASFVLPLAFLFQTADDGSKQIAWVSGRVFYKNGAPVTDASVKYHSFGPSSGITPEPAKTDREV